MTKECKVAPFTEEEMGKIRNAVDKIVFNAYTVWFGYPLRSPDKINEDLSAAKKELSEVRCADVVCS